jgi:hypothetical protein
MSVSVVEYTSNSPQDPIPVLRRCDYWPYIDVAIANNWPVLPPRVFPIGSWQRVEFVALTAPNQKLKSGYHFAYAALSNPGPNAVSMYIIFGDIPVAFDMRVGLNAVVTFFSLGSVPRIPISSTDTASVWNVGNLKQERDWEIRVHSEAMPTGHLAQYR